MTHQPVQEPPHNPLPTIGAEGYEQHALKCGGRTGLMESLLMPCPKTHPTTRTSHHDSHSPDERFSSRALCLHQISWSTCLICDHIAVRTAGAANTLPALLVMRMKAVGITAATCPAIIAAASAARGESARGRTILWLTIALRQHSLSGRPPPTSSQGLQARRQQHRASHKDTRGDQDDTWSVEVRWR